jgi:hypothetical protein
MAKYGEFEVLPDPHAPDLFADEAMSFHLVDGVVRIVLGTAKNTEGIAPSDIHFVVTGRLLMTVPTAQRFAVGLYDFLKKQGADPGASLAASDQKPN